jgi:cytoskeleton protein RodZ
MPDIGSTLREARMRARIDISEVETRTKIRAKYLRAIENEEWDLLPGPVYVKSFLRTYGDYLGLDSRMLIDENKRRYERPVDHELRPITALSRERERPPRGPLLPPWAVIAAVLVVVVVVLYILGTSGGTKSTPPVARVPPKPRQHHHRHKKKLLLPATPKTVKLQLAATGNVYVCLVNGTGTKLIPGVIYAPGQTIPTETAPKLLLTLGNASVQMKVNGSAMTVASSPNAIGYLIQPSGTTPLPASKQPSCT